MASSGSFSNSIVSGHYKLKVDWSQAQDVSANASTITCKMYLINDWSLGIGSRSNTCTIGGTAKSFTSSSISGTGTHTLGTVSQSVSHNSDGTKSITISAVFKIQATISGTYYEQITASATVTLNTIPRFRDLLICILCFGEVSKSRNGKHHHSNEGVIFFYPYAVVYFWKCKGNDCYKDHKHICFLDSAAYPGKPDTEIHHRHLHYNLHYV